MVKNYKRYKKWKDLPKNTQNYINFIRDYCGVKISSISTSPKREDTILLKDPFKKINFLKLNYLFYFYQA